MFTILLLLAITSSSGCMPLFFQLDEPVYDIQLNSLMEENMMESELNLFELAALKMKEQSDRKKENYENATKTCQLLIDQKASNKHKHFEIIPMGLCIFLTYIKK